MEGVNKEAVESRRMAAERKIGISAFTSTVDETRKSG